MIGVVPGAAIRSSAETSCRFPRLVAHPVVGQRLERGRGLPDSFGSATRSNSPTEESGSGSADGRASRPCARCAALFQVNRALGIEVLADHVEVRDVSGEHPVNAPAGLRTAGRSSACGSGVGRLVVGSRICSAL
jgi:hypothetical protein